MKKEDLYKNSTFDFFKFMLFDAYLAIPLALFIGYKIFQALPGNYFLAFMPLLLAGYLIFDIEITEITSTNKKFEKEELDYLKSKKFNFLYKSFNVINENSFTFIAVNKQKFYLHTKFTFLGEGKPTEIRKIYNLSDISSGYLKIHTDKREKISKKSMFKKGVAGGLIFGWKGVIAGALLSDINEDEIIDGWSLWINLKGYSRNIPLFPVFGLKDTPRWLVDSSFENSVAQKLYILLIEKDLSILEKEKEENKISSSKNKGNHKKTAQELWDEGKI
tara:strand:+ start:23 stop:850 length:828 start_codon:yes stop_codon:yes gene_type:complete